MKVKKKLVFYRVKGFQGIVDWKALGRKVGGNLSMARDNGCTIIIPEDNMDLVDGVLGAKEYAGVEWREAKLKVS